VRKFPAVLLASALLAGGHASWAESLAIFGATIIDGTGAAPLKDGVLVIEDGRIIAVGKRGIRVPANHRRLEAAGKYVIPGLMDANVHLFLDFFPLTLARFEDRVDEIVIEASQIALKNGLTTVFDSWGPRADLVKARDAIRAGTSVGSRIYLAGNIIGFGGPYTASFFPSASEALFEGFVDRINARWQENVGPELLWMPPDEVRRQLGKYLETGVDFLKYGATGHGGLEHYIAFSPRVQRIFVEEAHAAGITAQSHTSSVEGLDLAVEAGVDILQHCDETGNDHPIPAETIGKIVERRIPCSLLANTDKALAWFAEQAENSPAYKRFITRDINDRALIAAGAEILLSTDAGLFGADTVGSAFWASIVPPEDNLLLLGEGHFTWLRAVEEKGMQPMDILMAATRNIARAYGVDRDLGTLEVGKFADLLILDANPLVSADNYRTISLVMKEGQIVERDALPTQRLLSQDPSR
jgi:imidazolonepropionase-like amidohydrolase